MPKTASADLIGSREACDRLGIDRSTLSRWVAAQKITPAMQLPGERGAMLFYPADVARLERQTKAAS